MNDKMRNAVLNYKPQKVESLDFIQRSGEYNARVIKYEVLDSLTNWDGSAKQFDEPPGFVDPAIELAVMFGTDHGTVITRFHFGGYKTWEGLTDEERDSGDWELVQWHNRNYACKRNKKGQLERQEDAKKTSDALNYLNGFFTAAGKAEAENAEVALEELMSTREELNIVVEMEQYGDSKPQPKIKRFRAYREVATDEFGA